MIDPTTAKTIDDTVSAAGAAMSNAQDIVATLRDITPDVTGKSYYWGGKVKEAADEIERLQAELSAARADADRYRWLREKSVGQFHLPIVVSQRRGERGMKYTGPLCWGKLDAAIDAARAAPSASPARNEPQRILHGDNCEKVPHSRSDMLHDEGSDGAYEIDGLMYCGRCHIFLYSAGGQQT